MYMSNRYSRRFYVQFKSLVKDRDSRNLSEKEFEILLGLLITKEFNGRVQHDLSHVIPKNSRNETKFVSYDWNRVYA